MNTDVFDGSKSPNRDAAIASIKANEVMAMVESTSSTEEVSAVMEQGDNPNPNEVKDPKTFSLQPLCEAYKLVGGVSPQQREMATQARVMEAAVKDGEERIDRTAPLAESESQSKPESLVAGLDRTKTSMSNAINASASYLQREGNLTLSAQNGIRLTSLQGTTITGANTFLSTATTIINSQVSANASESIINLADFSLTRINGSSTTHVEDTIQLSTSNSITRATETSQVIATRTYNHGVELNSSTGSTMISTAGEGGHTIHSTGNVSTFTDSSITNLATQEITMGAGSPTSTGLDPQAEPSFDVLNAVQAAASFIRVVAGDSAGITSVTSGDSSSVSRGSQLVTASNTYVSAASTAAQVAGQQLMNGVMGSGGNPRSHVFHQGRMIIQGRMIGGFPSVDIDAIRFPTVPPLPSKPSAYSIKDLQNCIPKIEGDKEGELLSKDEAAINALKALGVDPSIIRKNAKNPSTSGSTTAETKPGETGTEQDLNTSNSEMSSSGTSNFSSTGSLLGTSISQMLSATSSGGGPTNVYPDIYGDKKEEEDEEQQVANTDEELIDSIWNSIKEKLPENNHEVAEFITKDLYKQGYRGQEEQDLVEGYVLNVREALKENGLLGNREIILQVMELMKEPISNQSMGMFQDLGSFPTISLPHIGSIGQVVQESFGIESIDSIINGLSSIESFSGTASSILNSLGVEIDLSSIQSISDIGSLITNQSLSDLLQNQAISSTLATVIGTSASSFIPLVNQILAGGISINDSELQDLIINVVTSEGISASLPDNYLPSLTTSIQNLIRGGTISLDQDQVMRVLESLGSNSMPFKILSGYREIESLIGNVSALASIPDLLSLMQDNDVPILSRASLLLSCLDIFNRVRSIMGSFESLASLLGQVNISGVNIPKNIIEQATGLLTNRFEAILPEDVEEIIHPLVDKEGVVTVLFPNGRLSDYYLLPDLSDPAFIYLLDENYVYGNEDLPETSRIPLADIQTIWSSGDLIWEQDEKDTTTTSINIPIKYEPFKKELVDNSGVSHFLESLPRTIQFMNLLDQASYEDIERAAELGLYKGEAAALSLVKGISIPRLREMESSSCFPIPKLDIYNSEIEVIGINEYSLSFSYKKIFCIGINSPIQIEVREYLTSSRQRLTIKESNTYYNPTYINYKVSSFSKNEGVGSAMLTHDERLILENSMGVMYKYYTKDIGKKIFPLIISSYLVQ